MIDIILSDKAYENDVYPLVKAFYPNETIKVTEGVIPIEPDAKADASASSGCTIFLKFDENRISITMIFASGQQMNQSELNEALKSTKSEYKNSMKRLLYRMLSNVSNKHLPWGILTGIRPTKLVYEMLEKNQEDQSIRAHMRDAYLCSDDKIEMSIRIASRELELLKDMDYQNGYSLYIGIPFCPSTCLYCSFPSYSIMKFSSYVEQYLKALQKEITFASTCFSNKKLTTVYLGGGTPTTLSAGQLDELLHFVREHFDFTYVQEFCVEAGRPDSITREKLEVLKNYGVDRISINPQSMQQRTLDLIGRKHSVDQIIEAFHMARESGHDNINMDIIIGLPGENPEDVKDTLRQIRKLNPESLTVHTLALKRAARLNMEKENYQDNKALDVPGMLAETIDFAKKNDYLPYYLYRQKNMADNLENIGYSRYGKEGIYNILIMEEKQTILALGAGAMSKFVFHKENRLERVDNVKSVTDYTSRIDELILRKHSFLLNNIDKL
jgi:oxygen-independent coproporphyrinogen-3 oxidase